MIHLTHRLRSSMLVLLVCFASPARSQSEPIRTLPPAGIGLEAQTLAALSEQTGQLRQALTLALASSADASAWRADVEIMVRAAELAIEQNLFYKPKDAENLRRLLAIAELRLSAVASGTRGRELMAIGSSGDASGRTLVGGFISRIDGSPQPYGLVLPTSFAEHPSTPRRLDVWLHGRGDTTTETPFILDRLSKVGAITPNDALVLHPFGRHCNAYKFAGEVDVHESIEDVQQRFPVAPHLISIRGFSMGGAGTWHLAAHEPGRWFAANPGAGFVDTIRYQGWDKKGAPFAMTDWGRRLMAWYDVPPHVTNLSNTRVIAYSGEIDPQRAGAQLMLDAAEQAGVEIEHVIGAGMGHKIDPESARVIDDRLAIWEAETTNDPRTRIEFVTHTLRYHRVDWLSIEGMTEHWQRARIQAELIAPVSVKIETENVDRLRLDFSQRPWPLGSGNLRLWIDGQSIVGPPVVKGEPVISEWILEDGRWIEIEGEDDSLRKRPGVQGPIDDALTGPLLFVLPSRPCRHGVVQRFVDREIEHARQTWRRVMRGEDRVVLDRDLTTDEIANHNLICFGDFGSNRYIASIAPSLPIRWQDDVIEVGGQTFDPSSHAVLMVYPNPQAPGRYVVLNSGVTFRESSHTTNSRQIAMLPDWAVVDVSESSDGIFPGRIVAADFFDERWKVKDSAPD